MNVVEFVTEGEAASVGEAQDLDDYQDVSDLIAPNYNAYWVILASIR